MQSLGCNTTCSIAGCESDGRRGDETAAAGHIPAPVWWRVALPTRAAVAATAAGIQPASARPLGPDADAAPAAGAAYWRSA